MLNRYIAEFSHRCVWLENYQAALTATQYLLDKGHRIIACVTSDIPIADRQERLKGYIDAMNRQGITPEKEWIISAPFTERGGEQAGYQLLNSQVPFTAVFTFNDVMAAGILRVLHQEGISLPRQMSVMGFDDVALARYLYPALTTMHYPVESMARRAALLAIRYSQQLTVRPASNAFTARLVCRQSVCEIPVNQA